MSASFTFFFFFLSSALESDDEELESLLLPFASSESVEALDENELDEESCFFLGDLEVGVPRRVSDLSA